ncbi:MAG: protein yceI precursor, partial [bacterium]|nr:protein yceI precursor [bacterium]
ELDRNNLRASKVEATIDAASVNTREPKRDAHLKSPDFIDDAKFPTLSFKSTRVDTAPGGGLKLTGDLTIRGVTKSVTFDVQPLSPDTKTPFGTTIVGTSATTRINRRDFGITGGTAGVMVGDEVNITLDLELVKQ